MIKGCLKPGPVLKVVSKTRPRLDLSTAQSGPARLKPGLTFGTDRQNDYPGPKIFYHKIFYILNLRSSWHKSNPKIQQ